MADVSKALNIVRKLNPMGFFSRAAEAANEIPQAKGTGEQMRAMLLKQGVKPDELKWTGFDEWAKGKKSVTRDEITEYLRRNEVQLGEKTLGADPAITEKVAARNSRLAAVSKETDEISKRELDAGRVPAQNPRWKELEKEYYSIIDAPFPEKLDPKFQQYTLPGGENYRELLLTMKDPQGVFRALNQKYDDPIAELTRKHQALNDEVKRIYADPNSTGNDFARAQDYARDANGEMRALILKRDREVAAAQQMERPYLSPHFDNEPDVLAHMRTQDRTDPEGRRVLHLEEAQSDYGQAGKKKGFTDRKAAIDQWVKDNAAANEKYLEAQKQHSELADQIMLRQKPLEPFNPSIESQSSYDYRKQQYNNQRVSFLDADPDYRASAFNLGRVRDQAQSLGPNLSEIVTIYPGSLLVHIGFQHFDDKFDVLSSVVSRSFVGTDYDYYERAN
jgi:hypothetical protein